MSNKGYIQKIRKSRLLKSVSVFLVLNILFEVIQPTAALALTEGPSQPEVQSFEPIGTTDMVDLFTGDFNYNIPLFNLPGPNGGYPMNLSYHAGITADDEASWTGLGWNINAGSLVRNMRGLPDEFHSETNGSAEVNAGSDFLEVKTDMKQNMTAGITGSQKIEILGGKLELDARAGFSMYYNNYRGFGASLDGSLTTEGNYAIGGGLSLDSENGMGISAIVAFDDNSKRADNRHKLSLTFDGNLSINYSLKSSSEIRDSKNNPTGRFGTGSFGNSYTFARTSFSPALAFKMTSFNATASLSQSTNVTASAYKGRTGSLFFRTEDYSSQHKDGHKHPVVGYDRIGEKASADMNQYTKDFNRERDGRITSGSVFLASSNYTFDTYTSTGQGLSGYFRPKRNDVGRSHDPYMRNEVYGGNIGFEAGPSHAAIDGGLNYGHNTQDAWDENNDMNYSFKNPKPVSTSNKADENLHYIAHGEQTIVDDHDISYMNSLDLPFLKLTSKGNGSAYGGKRKMQAGSNDSAYSTEKDKTKPRNKRNTVIHNFTNKEVSESGLGEFKVTYYDWTSELNYKTAPQQPFNRTTRNSVSIAKHYAGFKVLNEEGAYYVYGLPAYNQKEVSNIFSTDKNLDQNTTRLAGFETQNGEVHYKKHDHGHQYINKTSKSPYAHSYLLTSVQGADYVDLTGNGVSEDDLGYWVKFTYVKKASNFKWRAPFDHTKGFFNPGYRYTDEDDKASYQYGEKEMWYLGKVETKTHVAVFEMTEREDMIEAGGEISATGSGQKPLRLDRIAIYDKQSFNVSGTAARSLQEIHFKHEYLLCAGTLNGSPNNGQKKLTLTELWFTSNGSERGDNNHYKFEYGSNYNYQDGAFDSWGGYKPMLNSEFTSNFPYVNQFNQDWNLSKAWEPAYGSGKSDKASRDLTKTEQGKLAASWALKKITLPSGGIINIDYESDDYGYVQHKTANQMFKIAAFGQADGIAAHELYQDKDTEFIGSPQARRIYFKLEVPIPVGNFDNAARQIYKKYVEPIHAENGVRNLYFKSKMQLTESVSDYVSGYLPMEKDLKQTDGSTYYYGPAQLNSEINSLPAVETIDGQSCYTHGFITLKAAPKPKNPSEEFNYHPMALAAWTYMQTDMQELLMNNNSFSDDMDENQLISKIGDFFNVIPMIKESFGSIRKYSAEKGFARGVNLDLSCIRLASPDKIKYGGGHRVKQITITDSWGASTGNSGETRTYGQVYDYTMTENGEVISSGVASYEPQAGGDENSLKYPYYYSERQTYFTNNNLFAEAPVDESLFPGAGVGYRKVTVKSLNTENQTKNAPVGSNGKTSGVTEHEFYTAKEFPTMVEFSQLKEENSTLDVYNLGFPIPLIGTLKYNYYHGTQAFKIELNDMHGKPKSIKSFEVNNYVVNPNAITETIHEYQCEEVSYMGEKVKRLVNDVSVINNDDSHAVSSVKKRMGVEVDLFTDQRENTSFHMSAGMDFNVDVLPFGPGLPAPSVWPSYSNTKILFRTYVTNKVVNRSGILKKTVSRDLQTKNESEIIAYDEKSGIPILTKVTNEFGDSFYNYNIPAYYKYDGMGHAYQNIDYTFKTAFAASNCYYTFSSVNREDNLVRGDEMLISDDNGTVKGYFLGWVYNSSGSAIEKGMVHIPSGSLGTNEKTVRVIRSGRRNHYATMAASYVTKGLPSVSNFTVDDAEGADYTAKRFAANSVLSASASLFRDDWTQDVKGSYSSTVFNYVDRDGVSRQAVLEKFDGDNVINSFLTGGSGIWRSHKTYSFVGPRKGTRALDAANTTNPDLRNDGLFTEAVPLFDWNLGIIEEYSFNGANPFANWEWTSEITRYSSDAYELENVNRLGVYSSALYGYDNSLSIGVSGNASYYETGTMDFEKVSNSSVFGETIYQNNINLYKSATGRPAKMLVTEQKNFSTAIVNGNNIDVYVKFKNLQEKDAFLASLNQLNYIPENTIPPYPATPANYQSSADGLENTFGIALVSKTTSGMKGNASTFLNAKYIDRTTISDTELKLTFKTYVCTSDDTPKYLKQNTRYQGKLTMLFKKKVSDLVTPANYSFVKTGTEPMRAHSGKAFMKVTGSSIFDQPTLKVIPDKSYVFSCWISRADSDVKTYQQSILLQACVLDVNGNSHLEIPGAVYKYGRIIEGWQKVDVEFKIPAIVSSAANPYANKIFAFKFNPGANALYVDDVRFSPKTGGMKTFVYDPVNYRLSASLNVDNYGSFFYYDEEGNLTHTKQETEEGIFTVSQNRSRLKKQP